MGTHTISTHVHKTPQNSDNMTETDKDQSGSEKLKYQKPPRPRTQTTEPTQDNKRTAKRKTSQNNQDTM